MKKARRSQPAPTLPTPGQSSVWWQQPRTQTWIGFLVVFVVGWFCFAQGRAEPPHLFWDENYHVTSAERYLQGIAQLEPHPPLGHMLIALGEKLLGTNQDIDKHSLINKKQITGDDLPTGFDFSGMRFMPALFAIFGALAFYGLMLAIFEKPIHALLLSGLYLFENAFTVHFRAVHLDSFQIFFCIASLWRFVVLLDHPNPLARHYVGLTMLIGLGMMVKINSGVLLLLPVILFIHESIRARQIKLLDLLHKSSLSIAALMAVIFAVFYLHAALSRTAPNANSPAGSQDLGSMSEPYLRFLRNHETITPNLVVAIGIDYFKFMKRDHEGVPKLDTSKPGENGSHPLHWPFHDRNINYRWDSADGKTSYVQLIGNQLAWYSSTIAVVFCLFLTLNTRVFGIRPACAPRTYQLIEIFTGLYIAFMAMSLWLISKRVMYLYHYFIGLVLAYVLLALVWRYFVETNQRIARWRTQVLAGVMTLYLVSYLFFLPLSNHWPMTKEQCEKRNIWISQIVSCR